MLAISHFLAELEIPESDLHLVADSALLPSLVHAAGYFCFDESSVDDVEEEKESLLLAYRHRSVATSSYHLKHDMSDQALLHRHDKHVDESDDEQGDDDDSMNRGEEEETSSHSNVEAGLFRQSAESDRLFVPSAEVYDLFDSIVSFQLDLALRKYRIDLSQSLKVMIVMIVMIVIVIVIRKG